MKTSVPLICGCGEPFLAEATGTALPKIKRCPRCGSPLFFTDPLGNVVGLRILSRAHSELIDQEDFTLTIILSAMAVECEMSRLFIHWKGMDQMRAKQTGIMPAKEEVDMWAKEWKKLFSLGKRLDELSTLLTGQNFDSFLSQNSGLLNAIYSKYSAFKSHTSPKEGFQQELFNRRNTVLHHGQIDFMQGEAEICYTLASGLTNILKQMNNQRIAVLDAALEAERAALK